MRRPLGCLTRAGIIVGVLVLLLLVGVALVWGGSPFSPGALNAQDGATLGGVTSHASTAGHCSACHPAPWSGQTMSERCLSCHTQVTAELQTPTSLHGALQKQDPKSRCQNCHPEHRGPTGALTLLDEKSFPHAALGYSLQAHQKTAQGTAFTCQDCHPQSLSQFDVAICATCHQQIDATFMQAHVAAYGTQCLPCHDGIDTYGKNFDHSKVAFPLTGKHATTPCGGCHTGARTIADFKATPRQCYACHAKDDAHRGQFGQDCAQCHSAAAWSDVTFDHSKTAFPLTGAHVQVACVKCHVNGVFKGTPTACVGCHPDPTFHLGLLGTDCAKCHTTTAWSPAQLNQPHPFPFDHGARASAGGSNTCLTCHPTDLNTYTCYAGCHFHDEAQIVTRHSEEGITNITDCVRCHPTGGRGEGGGFGGD